MKHDPIFFASDDHDDPEELDVRSTYVNQPPKWHLLGLKERAKSYPAKTRRQTKGVTSNG